MRKFAVLAVALIALALPLFAGSDALKTPAPSPGWAQVYPAPPNVGLLAARPTFCALTGQQYYATDNTTLYYATVAGTSCTWTAVGGAGSGSFTALTAGTNTNSGAFIWSQAGTFTNATPGVNGPNIQASVNSCSPSTEWLTFNRSGTADTEAITGCIVIGAGSTATQATGVAGYANVSSTSTNGVGGYFQGVCTATATFCWGGNTIAETLSGHAAAFVQSLEADLNSQNTGDAGTAVDIAGAWTAQPTRSLTTSGSMPAIKISKPIAVSGGPYFWSTGISCDTGATSDSNAANLGSCITLNPALTSSGSFAQSIVYHARASDSTIKTLYGTVGTDAAKLPYAAVIDAVNGFGAYQALLPVHSFNYTGLSPNNIISAGTVAVSSSTTGSTTFSTPYATAPICTASPAADPTAIGVWWVTSSTTVVTVTVKVSGTLTFDYQCIPAAN